MGFNGADIVFPHLGIAIRKIVNHFTVFGVDITFYGLIIGCAFLLGMFLAAELAKKKGMNPDLYWDFYIYLVIAGVVGARLYYVLFNLDYYIENPSKIFNIREGGLAIYGGVIAVVLVMIVYCRKKKLKFTAFSDNIIPSLLLGQAMGRWGNFLNCECFGGYTDSLFAMRIRRPLANSSMVNEEILSHLVTDGGVEYIQVHPTFFYESAWNFATLIFLLWFKRKKQKTDGEMLWLYMIFYGIGRFIIEGMRTDSLMIGHTDLRISQCVALLSAIAGTVILILARRNLRKKAAAGAGTAAGTTEEIRKETAEGTSEGTEESVKEPAEEAAEETTEETAEEPAEETAEEAAEGTSEGTEESVKEPAEEAAEEPVGGP